MPSPTCSLDNLGGSAYPSLANLGGINYGSIETELDSGHIGDADSQDARARPAPRLRNRAADSAIVGRRFEGRRRLALPGALPNGGAGMDRGRMGRFGKQPPRQVLQAHPRGAQTTRRRDLELGAARRGDTQRFEDCLERGIRNGYHQRYSTPPWRPHSEGNPGSRARGG